jgi:hypothetical protein
MRARGLVLGGEQGIKSAGDDLLDAWWGKNAARHAVDEDPASLPPSKTLRPLRLDFPGYDVWAAAGVRGLEPWVAIPVFDRQRIVDRVVQKNAVDYAYAMDGGAQGVSLVFMLRQAQVYEVFDRGRKLGPRRVFMRHDGQSWKDLTRESARSLCS